MHDGTEVYIEVTRPADDAGQPLDGQWPVILEASPYHGTLADREGMRILPDPRDENGTSLGLTGYFVPTGYAVVMMDLRGTGKSERLPRPPRPPTTRRTSKDVVEWAAVPAVVQRPRRHDRALLRRLHAVARRRAWTPRAW